MSQRFPELPPGYPFPALEQEVLAFWRNQRIFEKSLERRADAPPFVFFEGPPTANNVPHVGHVVARVVKDLFPRFRTLQGFRVPRKAGWDTHGLPVEIEVEKRLGFSGKKEIEQYGIAEFNRACLESVSTYERDWRAMTERLGYWLDLDHAYKTYTNDYVESVWWSLSEFWKKGLLEEGYKVQPYCGRCGTTLSSHEVAQNYKDIEDPSIWVLFPVRPGQGIATVEGGSWVTPSGFSAIAWTTTPWTTPGHTALAVHPDLVYRVVEMPHRPGELALFADAIEVPVPYDAEVEGKRQRRDLRDQPAVARFFGRDLAGLTYERPFAVPPADRLLGTPAFDPPPSDEAGWRVVTADYVTATDGTGIVHTAPAFGADDYATGVKYGLPMLQTVEASGRIGDRKGLEPFAGHWFKDADAKITQDLKARGRLLHADRYHHSYPFCWRCDNPLLQYATKSWFVATTKRKQELIDRNREVHWHPEHVGEGRFGNWLENVVDWALSRRRYWGTPLPVWRCDRPECGALHTVGSYAELFAAVGQPLPANPYDRAQFDPHRPYIDAMTWSCRACDEGTMRRVEEVIDAWYDSGAMPFAQHHYPFENREIFEGPAASRQFPANFICEGVDQTRGWFYTLHVLGVLLFDSITYENCVVVGHVNDEKGRKMSKRLGNVVEPMAVMAETGADALRWYFYETNPELTSRFSARLVRESAQKFLIPLANALSFFTIYANLDGWRPGLPAPAFASRPALDRWILLRLDRAVAATTEHLSTYQIPEAARKLEELVDDLTDWYIRRSRDRFWAPPGGNAEVSAENKLSAYQALYEVLTVLSRLLAPFVPFFADTLHRVLERSQDSGAAESVHLTDWPTPAGDRHDDALDLGMAAVHRAVRLGHAARNLHNLKTRQPLPAVTLVTADARLRESMTPYLDLLADELNVKEVRWAEERGQYVRCEVRPIFSRLGPRLGKRMAAVKAALDGADGDSLAATVEGEGRITLALADGPVELAAEDLEIRLIEREGTATQGDRELLVALETDLTPALIDEGRAREVVHKIQSARKDARLDYADRIRVRYHAAPELGQALRSFAGWIAGETLAVELTAVDGDASAALTVSPVEDLDFAFAIERI